MPIGYEPMQPVDTRISQAYGAALAREKDREFALKATGQAQDFGLRSSALAQQDEHFAAEQANRASLAYAQMGHQEAMQQQQQAGQMEMQRRSQQFEFTQADNLRLQNLNQARAGWEAMRASNEISPEEYQQGIAQLDQQRDPLRARREATEQQHIQRQNQQMMDQHAAAAARQTLADNYRLNSTNGRMEHRDDEGRLFAVTIPDGSGAFHTQQVPPDRATATAERRDAQVADLFTRTYAAQIDRLTKAQADPLSPADIRALTPDQIEARALERTNTITGAFRRQLEAGGASGAQASSGQGGAAVVGQGASQMVVPPTGRIPDPGVRAAGESAHVPMARIRTVAEIANALTPGRGAPMQGGPIDWSNETERTLAMQMHDIIGEARRAGRSLTNREATDFENARRNLETVNPDAARLYSLAPTPEQRAYGISQGRSDELKTLTPLLRDEAGRIFNSTSMTGRIGEQIGSSTLGTPGVQHVGRMYELLNTATQENRHLTHAETTRYLRDWRQLRRLNSGWADRLSLHQD